jgi:hypothetical protein
VNYLSHHEMEDACFPEVFDEIRSMNAGTQAARTKGAESAGKTVRISTCCAPLVHGVACHPALDGPRHARNIPPNQRPREHYFSESL